MKNFDDFEKYDWYNDNTCKDKVTDETEVINDTKIYYGKLKIEKVYVTFYVNDTKKETVTIEKGKTFTDANAAAVKNGFDTSEYEWFEDEQFTKPAVDEPILTEKIYYGRLITQKVQVTFFVNENNKQDVIVPMGAGFEFSKKLVKTFDVNEYEWFEDNTFNTPAVVDAPILKDKTYYGQPKTPGNNGDNNNNGGNNNNGDNSNTGDNGNTGGNGNNGGNNNNGDNGNNGNNTTPTAPTTPIVATEPTVPESNITIPDDTTPLSPAPAEVSTTPTTESEDNNENIDIEDDDTALGTAVMDKDNDVDEAEDVTVPVKTKKKVVAKEEKSLDINADDTPLGATLPKTGGSFGFIYILFGLLLSAFGIKKFREK